MPHEMPSVLTCGLNFKKKKLFFFFQFRLKRESAMYTPLIKEECCNVRAVTLATTRSCFLFFIFYFYRVSIYDIRS